MAEGQHKGEVASHTILNLDRELNSISKWIFTSKIGGRDLKAKLSAGRDILGTQKQRSEQGTHVCILQFMTDLHKSIHETQNHLGKYN